MDCPNRRIASPSQSFTSKTMESVEIVGVAAAAIQFAQAGMAITKVVYSTVLSLKISVEVQRERLKKVSQLEALFAAITPHPTFQTEAIKPELEICLRGVTRLNELINRLSERVSHRQQVEELVQKSSCPPQRRRDRDTWPSWRDKGSLALALQAAN
ncbi:hypothetical protein N0V84_003900 [Fusarium piperis]|uniref:Fungal N-terminal domain-containing protein n=1 Tax=Fusarium piperis TaxID=1435070 RepID=A0A9W9BS21_9HYPO|nr:hypothetical protein N0V84_003900 [Fusarium piperis]